MTTQSKSKSKTFPKGTDFAEIAEFVTAQINAYTKEEAYKGIIRRMKKQQAG